MENRDFTPSEGVAEKQANRTLSEGVERTEGGMEECGGRGWGRPTAGGRGV